MQQIEYYYKVGFVKNAAHEEDSSFMWVSPIRELSSKSEVKDVEVFEERVNQVFTDSSSELLRDASSKDSEKPDLCPGGIVCVQHHHTWVRGEIISATASCQEADDDSQIFTIFLVDHALLVKLPLKMCKPIPENIIPPKVRFLFNNFCSYLMIFVFRKCCRNDWNFALELFLSWKYIC